ncbi:MAG: polysaccharide deacetylase family protein [Roseburia sp.]|nr:polysaccharide deacetylase family protein [Roseburia sp.]MCM1098254.1 polysaccharide deacetylase family protein [Ruminococcus flavefaciens]
MKTIYVKEIPSKLLRGRKVEWKKAIPTAVFLLAMFFLGRATAETLAEARLTAGQTTDEYSAGAFGGAEAEISGIEEKLLQEENWGLGFGKSGEKPTGNATIAEMKKNNAYYMAEGDEKVLYLTFDCGYENGNTEPILDALEKHNVKATFFVVGHFLETAPELVNRMVEAGHTVGNHTYHHPDMSKISDIDDFRRETEAVAALFKEITRTDMAMYYRPPQGKYSEANLQMAKKLGYSTFFWSLAYVDWNVDDQPSHEEALEKLTSRVHPGAIVLLHNTSQTNGEIMDEILTRWEEMGYTFGTLGELLEGM